MSIQQIFAHDLFVLPVFGALVFAATFFLIEPLLAWLHKRSLGQREEVIRLLELMFVDTTSKQVTWAMLAMSFGVGILFFLLFWPNLIFGFVVGGIVTIAMWSVPKFIVQSMWEKRCSRFVTQMVDAMTMMANGVKAGLSVQQCMERVNEVMPNPISQEFGLVLSQMRLGRSMQEGLNELAERVPKPEVQMFVTSVNILQETGGNIGETFATIVSTIRERQKVEKKIEALTAQGVTQGIIITMVPLAMLVLFAIVDPGYIKPLFGTTMGWFALTAVFTLQILGGLMIKKIVKIKV